jgi:transcriptional regulator with XRE-family HTH domain
MKRSLRGRLGAGFARSVVLPVVGSRAVLEAWRDFTGLEHQPARLSTSASYVTNVEAGRVNLTLGQLTRIAAAIGARLDVALNLESVERTRVLELA